MTGPGGGPHYLIYSFAPGVRVINAFLQSVTGLFDLVQAGGGPRAATLYSAGEREAERELPSYDTGAWSLYQPGEESPLSYHELVRDFLRDLCTRTGREVFCSTADRFTDYLHEPPVLELLTRTVTAGRTGLVRFRLTKISRLGMVINSADGATVLATSATVSRGVHGYAWRPPRHPGIYSVRLRATDLAGNVGRASGTLDVLPTR